MEYLSGLLQKISKGLAVVAGVSLTLMMLLTVTDVTLRAFGHPIVGSYEIVGFMLALVIGFAIPRVSLRKQHIYMDFLVERLGKKNRALMTILTRVMNLLLFLLIGYSLFLVGNEFRVSGELSPTVRIPFYPMAFGVAVCCFIECFVFICEIAKSWGDIHE
jgi:TRAP-type C4-dicarboxylate transport system permease small subunit